LRILLASCLAGFWCSLAVLVIRHLASRLRGLGALHGSKPLFLDLPRRSQRGPRPQPKPTLAKTQRTPRRQDREALTLCVLGVFARDISPWISVSYVRCFPRSSRENKTRTGSSTETGRLGPEVTAGGGCATFLCRGLLVLVGQGLVVMPEWSFIFSFQLTRSMSWFIIL
jgi:hypothetical protein